MALECSIKKVRGKEIDDRDGGRSKKVREDGGLPGEGYLNLQTETAATYLQGETQEEKKEKWKGSLSSKTLLSKALGKK